MCLNTSFWQQVAFVKAFLTSHAILLEELKNLSNTISQTIDLTGFISNHNEIKPMVTANPEASQVADKMQNDSEVVLFMDIVQWFSLLVSYYSEFHFLYLSFSLTGSNEHHWLPYWLSLFPTKGWTFPSNGDSWRSNSPLMEDIFEIS